MILQTQQAISDVKATIVKQKEKHLLEITNLEADVRRLEAQLHLLLLNIDLVKYERATKLLSINYEQNKVEILLLDKAIADLLTGITKLHYTYYGMKRYSGYFQESDHPYGYGPKHGYIVQSIGLSNRKKIYTNNEIEDMLYLLSVVKNNKGYDPMSVTTASC